MNQRPSVFDRYRDAVELELEQILGQRQGLLYNMMRYQLGWVDPQGSPLPKPRIDNLRSTLCLLSCESVGGDYPAALPVAAALELLYAFTLVHGDVQNGNPQREERPSVWWIWGPGQAINVGDGLHALGRTALFRLKERGLSPTKVLKALRVLDEACIKTCEGQYMDLDFQERLDLSVSSYLKMVEDKTGAFMGCTMELGALTGTDDQRVLEAFRDCGRKLGLAWQIRQDLLALWKGGEDQSPSPEVLNKKKVFPVVYLLEKGHLKAKHKLGTIYFKRVLEPGDVQEVLALLEETGARQAAEARVEGYLQEALAALDGLNLSPWGLEQIGILGRYMAGREQ